MRPLLLAALLLLVAAPLAAQCSGGEGSLHCWVSWKASDPFRNHPQSHAIGGLGLDLVARGPWFAPSWRNRTWKRLVIVAVLQSAWEAEQLKETAGYPQSYAALDVGAAVLGAGLAELFFAKGLKR